MMRGTVWSWGLAGALATNKVYGIKSANEVMLRA